MKTEASPRNFHLPLPDKIYRELREEAARTQQSATALARLAIEAWLEQRRAAALHAEIAAYAAQHAGTVLDLDEEMEAAALETLRDQPKRPAVRRSSKGRSR